MLVQFNFVWGLCFGIEHLSGDEEDEFVSLFVIHLGLLRIGLMTFSND